MILIFTNENELSSLEVAKRLNFYKKEFYIINPEEDIFRFSKVDDKGIYFKNNLLNKDINLLDATACWWRRTGLGVNNFVESNFSDKIIKNENHNFNDILFGKKSVLNSEFSDLKDYVFQRIFENSKINLGHPKLYGLNRLTILDLARNYGLKTPYYEVISNTNQLNSSEKIGNNFVSKAIANGIYHVIDGKSYYTYTELQKREDYTNKNINIFPSLIMNLVDKKFEIRSFYIDGKFYSMAIFSQSNEQTKVDFRKYSSSRPNKNEPFQLPIEIELKLENLFKDIGLNTGSVDLIVNTKNEYVFLEINPVGQYGMTSEPCNYNLDEKITKYLINGTIS